MPNPGPSSVSKQAIPENSNLADLLNYACGNYPQYNHFWERGSRNQREEFIRGLIDQAGGINNMGMMELPAFLDIMTEFLPSNTERPEMFESGIKYAESIHAIINDDLAAIILSGMLTAIHIDTHSRDRSDNIDIRFGEKLCDFFIEIGANKLGQALHSFDGTKKEFKIGLARSKHSADILSEEEFIDAFMKAVGVSDYSELIDRITIGQMRGSGSYVQVHRVTVAPEYLARNPAMETASKEFGLVAKCVKADAASRHDKMFLFIIDLINDSVSRHGEEHEASGSIPILGLLPIMRHYHAMLAEETNFLFVAPKVAICEKLYTGIQACSQHRNFDMEVTFVTDGMFDHDQGFAISKDIPWKRFNELVEEHGSDSELIIALAQSIYLPELFFVLAGLPSNHDCHGDNLGIKIEESVQDGRTKYIVTVGHYDPNGTALKKPPSDQNRLFANLVMDSIGSMTFNGKDLAKAIKESFKRLEILKHQKKLDGKLEINSQVKTLLSLTDYSSKMNQGLPKTQADRFLSVLRAIVLIGQIDPEIAEVCKVRFRAIALLASDQEVSDPEDQRLVAREKERREMFYPPEGGILARMKSGIMSPFMKIVLRRAVKELSEGDTNHQLSLPDGYMDRFSE